jgi:SNF2 family DNA or RNA helicase
VFQQKKMAKRSFDMSSLQQALAPSSTSAREIRERFVAVRHTPTQSASQSQVRHPFVAPDLLPEQRSMFVQPFLQLTAHVRTAKKPRVLQRAELTELPPISIAFRQLLMTSTPQELALYQTHRFIPELDLWMRLPHQLHKYQLDVILWMQKRSDGGLLCLAMGLGKTVIASAYMLLGTGPVPAEAMVQRASTPQALTQAQPQTQPQTLPEMLNPSSSSSSSSSSQAHTFSVACLVLVPGPLVDTWLSEVFKFFGRRIRIAKHETKDRMTQADLESHQIIIITYDQISIMSEASPAFKVRWRTIVADESQRFVNARTVLFKALKNLTARQKFCLSGTPWNNCSDDVKNQLAFVRTTSPSCEPPPLTEPEVIPYIHAINYSDVDMRLPPKHFHTIDVDMDARSRALYDAVRSAGNIAPFVKVQILREIAICAYMARNMVIKYEIVPPTEAHDVPGFHAWLCDQRGTAGAQSPKMLRLQGLLAQRGGRQALVFSAFNESLELASTKVESGTTTCQLTSNVVPHARPQIIDSFISGATEVLFLTFKLGGVGLNLQNCNLIILLDRWWTASLISQAITRCHRLGQKQPVTVYSLVTRDTVEIHVDEVADTKGIQSDLLLQSASQARLEHVFEEDEREERDAEERDTEDAMLEAMLAPCD